MQFNNEQSKPMFEYQMSLKSSFFIISDDPYDKLERINIQQTNTNMNILTKKD